MTHQMSDTVHQLSHLKDAGSLIDKKYLRKLIAPGSKLTQAIDELLDDFKTFPEVVKANKQVLDESGFKANSLFGGKAAQWVFSFTKPAHKSKLFFEVMGLKPVSQTKTGADAVDKKFIEHYKDRSFLVSKFSEFQQATKLLSTYAKGWYKKITTEIDGVEDSHLRADYAFFNVDTGRLGSADPNLQNIPARGKLAKIIKEMFITSDGHILIRFDYSAHEVRGWAIVAKDKVLAAAFITGQQLRQMWIKAIPPKQEDTELRKLFNTWWNYDRETGKFTWKQSPGRKCPVGTPAGGDREDATYLKLDGNVYLAHRVAFLMHYGYLPEEVDHIDVNPNNNAILNLRPATMHSLDSGNADYRHPFFRIQEDLKQRGDIHIQNCFRFFQKWVEKSDPLRDAVKSVAFG
jgi:hypothetical protein